MYVTENLLLPSPGHESQREIFQIHSIAMARLLLKTKADLVLLWSEMEAAKQRQLKLELEKLAGAEPEQLKAGLADNNPLFQLTAVQAIHNRRIHLEKELIACLSSSQPVIRESAHQALVRLSRGADFGPKPGAGVLERRNCVRRWQTWLALQKGPAPSAKPVPLDPIEAEAARLATELVQAGNDKENDILQRVRNAPEPQGTLALSCAIPQLRGMRQNKARQALADRLAKQDPDALKNRLTDEDTEVRRAALAAAAKHKAGPLIPDALKLLEDPDVGVAQGARAALKVLTNQDFGPSANASSLDRSIAIGRWYQWWLKQQKEK